MTTSKKAAPGLSVRGFFHLRLQSAFTARRLRDSDLPFRLRAGLSGAGRWRTRRRAKQARSEASARQNA